MKFPHIFHTSLVNIHHAAFWLAFFSVCSALLGLMRDRMLAGLFGAGRELDVYYAAFRIPDSLYTVMLLFAASTAIIPIFLEDLAKNKERAERLFGALLSLFCVVMILMAGLSLFLMPTILTVLLPGFSPEELDMTVLLSRIMLLSPFFLGISNIISSVTQSFRRFFVYALSPVLYNIGIIIGISFFLPRMGFWGLAWGVALGAFLHMAIQIPSMVQLGVWPKKNLWSEDLKRVLLLSFPRTVGLATTQVATIIFTGVASTLAAGSIAIFNFASNLEYIPVTLIGLSYSVAAFPNLTEYALRGAKDEFKKHFAIAFRHILFWALPFSVLLLVLRAQVVRVILGSGAFSWIDTRLTAATLFLLSLAIIFQSLFMLLVRAFYAENQTMRPLAINTISALVSVGAVFWFVRALSGPTYTAAFLKIILHVRDIPDIRVIALSLGILGGSIINFVFLFFAFRIVFGWVPSAGSGWAIAKIVTGSVTAGMAAYGGLSIFSRIFDLQTFLGIFAQGLFAGVIGIIAGTVILWVLKSDEIQEIYLGMRNLIWKDHVAIPEPEKLP